VQEVRKHDRTSSTPLDGIDERTERYEIGVRRLDENWSQLEALLIGEASQALDRLRHPRTRTNQLLTDVAKQQHRFALSFHIYSSAHTRGTS
jgi:hypothetical protein